MSDPKNAGEALDLMMDWASGRRSYCNLGPHAPYTPDVIAVMDAQEVVKWSVVVETFGDADYRALLVRRNHGIGGDDD